MLYKQLLLTVLAVMMGMGTVKVHAQQVALKTNLLYDATATPNLGLEVGVGKKHSLQLFYGLHPWKFGHGDDQKFLKHWVLNPEWRYWPCHRFNGSFFGIHAFGGQYNAAKVKMPFGWWKELENPVTKMLMSWVDALVFALVAVYFVNIYLYMYQHYSFFQLDLPI